MKRLNLLILCLFLLASAPAREACAQDAAKTLGSPAPTQPASKAGQAKKAAAKAQAKKAQAKTDQKKTDQAKKNQPKKSPAGKGQTGKGQAGKGKTTKAQADGRTLSKEELLSPYSPEDAQQNATRWDFDPTPKARPFAKPEEPSALNLRLGREEVVDPLTRREVTPKPDPAAAKENLKNMDLKGAMDKVGGKAEVQMEILKF